MTNWEMTVELINILIGLGWGPNTRERSVLKLFKEVTGDFGEPSDGDLADFRRLTRALPTSNGRQNTAKDGILTALNLYSPGG